MRLLLVEDDTMIGEVVLDRLRAEHFAVDGVRDGDMAGTALRTRHYDLVLLDLGLPRRDGLDVLRSLRARKDTTPVLIVTARDAVHERIAGLVLWLVIRHSLDPLERTRQQVAARALDDLSPVPEAGLPDEVRPLVQELNLLFGRLGAAVAAQQSFVAHAAHELRSPLTALKLQAQALERPLDPEARSQSVARLHQGIDRAIRLMQQLLVLARQEASTVSGDRLQPVDLPALARQVIAEMLPAAQARTMDLGIEAPGSDTVQGDADTLAILLRNLVENAVKYSPQGGRIDVHVTTRGGQTALTVEDSGPGIPPQEQPHVFERFFRGARAQAAGGGDGSGLGLAIVQAIARRHRAQVQLAQSERLGGLIVRVLFPPASEGAT